MCRKACPGTQKVVEPWQRWLRLVEALGCSSLTHLFSAFLFPLCLDKFGRHSYIFYHLTDFSSVQWHSYTMDLTLTSGLQITLITHRMGETYKKENLSTEQRYINNFNKIIHRHEKQNPNNQLMFACQKCPQLVQLIWWGTEISK